MSLNNYSDFGAIVSDFKGVLLDAYGVFWGSNAIGPLPGAKEAMQMLVSSGKIVGVLSNSSQLASDDVAKLQRHGIVQGTHFYFLVTSGEVARMMFLHDKPPFPAPKKTFYLFGDIPHRSSSHEAIFRNTAYCPTADVSQADFIYVSIPHLNGEDQSDLELFRKEVGRLVPYHLPMVCANPDQFAIRSVLKFFLF